MGFSEDFSAMNDLMNNSKSIDEKLEGFANAPATTEHIDGFIELGEKVKSAYEAVKRGKSDSKTKSMKMMAGRVTKTGIDKRFDRDFVRISRRLNREFSSAYKRCNRLEGGRLEKQREALDEICGRYFQLAQTTPVRKRQSRVRNRSIESYSSFREQVKAIDEIASQLADEYQNAEFRTRDEAKRMLKRFNGISRAYRRAFARHLPQTKVWWINPHKAYGFVDRAESVRKELKEIVRGFDDIKSEIKRIRAEKRKADETAKYAESMPKDESPKDLLALLAGKKMKISQSPVSGYTLFRKEWLSYADSVTKANEIVENRKKEAIDLVLQGIAEAYHQIGGFLEMKFSSECYEIEREKSKKSLEMAISSIKILEGNSGMDLSSQKRKYCDLKSEVKSRESGFEERKKDEEGRRALEEKKIDLKRDLLAKRGEIAKMELEQSRNNYRAVAEMSKRQETIERERFGTSRAERYRLYVEESPRAVTFGSIDGSAYFNMHLHIRRLEFNENYRALARAASKPESGIQALERIAEVLNEMVSAGMSARNENDLQYMETFYNCVKESLKRGQFARLRTRENEPLIEGMLDMFEEYISKSKESMPPEPSAGTIQASLQYSTAG